MSVNSVDSVDVEIGSGTRSEIDSKIDWASRPDLDDAVVTAYLWIASRGHLSRDDIGPLAQRLGMTGQSCRDVIESLWRRGLLSATNNPPGYSPVSPRAASAILLSPAESVLEETERDLLDRWRRVRRWRSDLTRLPSPAADPLIETLDNPHAAQACLEDALASAESEVLVSRPGGEGSASNSTSALMSPSPSALPLALALTLPGESALLGRGVTLRVVYQHTARFHRPTQLRAAAAIAAGAQIRTLSSPPPPMIVIDRSSVFLPHSERADAAVLIKESSTVAHLCASFDQAWSLGSAFRTGPVGARQATDDLKSSIVRMLAGGLKDDAIAKRLGLSVRSLRGHIAEIMSRLGADSRFQAGVHVAQADWLTEAQLPRDIALI